MGTDSEEHLTKLLDDMITKKTDFWESYEAICESITCESNANTIKDKSKSKSVMFKNFYGSMGLKTGDGITVVANGRVMCGSIISD